MTQVKAMIEPYSILNNFRWKSVTLVQRGWSLHPTITLYRQLTWQYRFASKVDAGDSGTEVQLNIGVVIKRRWLDVQAFCRQFAREKFFG